MTIISSIKNLNSVDKSIIEKSNNNEKQITAIPIPTSTQTNNAVSFIVLDGSSCSIL